MSRQPSAPAVAMSVTTRFVSAVVFWVTWIARHLIWPVLRLGWRVLRRWWIDAGRKRALRKGRRQFRLSRRQRRHVLNAHYNADPLLVQRSLWWCLWALSREAPAAHIAELMNSTDRHWADAVGYVTAQIYSIPARHPEEITAAVWAMELRAIHDIDRPLPQVDS